MPDSITIQPSGRLAIPQLADPSRGRAARDEKFINDAQSVFTNLLGTGVNLYGRKQRQEIEALEQELQIDRDLDVAGVLQKNPSRRFTLGRGLIQRLVSSRDGRIAAEDFRLQAAELFENTNLQADPAALRERFADARDEFVVARNLSGAGLASFLDTSDRDILGHLETAVRNRGAVLHQQAVNGAAAGVHAAYRATPADDEDYLHVVQYMQETLLEGAFTAEDRTDTEAAFTNSLLEIAAGSDISNIDSHKDLLRAALKQREEGGTIIQDPAFRKRLKEQLGELDRLEATLGNKRAEDLEEKRKVASSETQRDLLLEMSRNDGKITPRALALYNQWVELEVSLGRGVIDSLEDLTGAINQIKRGLPDAQADPRADEQLLRDARLGNISISDVIDRPNTSSEARREALRTFSSPEAYVFTTPEYNEHIRILGTAPLFEDPIEGGSSARLYDLRAVANLEIEKVFQGKPELLADTPEAAARRSAIIRGIVVNVRDKGRAELDDPENQVQGLSPAELEKRVLHRLAIEQEELVRQQREKRRREEFDALMQSIGVVDMPGVYDDTGYLKLLLEE